MMEKNRIEIIRYTLQSYIEDEEYTKPLNDRQKEEVLRLAKISNERFYSLVEDINNEIQRRSGISHNIQGQVHKQLSKLSDLKLRILTKVVLIVLNGKNNIDKEKKHNDVFLIELQDLIKDLKTRSEESTFLKSVDELAFLDIISEYNKYIKRKNIIGSEITDRIEKLLQDEGKKYEIKIFESLKDPLKLVEMMDRSEISETYEYQYRREKIQELISIKEIPQKERQKLLKSEMIHVLLLEFERKNILDEKPMNIVSMELRKIVDVLEIIEKNLENGEKLNIEKYQYEIKSSVAEMKKRLGRDSTKYATYITNLEKYEEALGDLPLAAGEKESLMAITALAKEIYGSFCKL